MIWTGNSIDGVLIRQLQRHADTRGCLFELFRRDELPDGFSPAMAYISTTRPGVARGPHEHRAQTDGFAFVNGAFDLYLWENRTGKPELTVVLRVGVENPVFVTVPPGVVHAYKNVGGNDAYVVNLPDQLYGGHGKVEEVDEIRHEEQPGSRFKL